MMTIVSKPGDDETGDLVVRRPRVTDAIGGALLGTYGHRPSVPAEMRVLLDRLDMPVPRRP